MVRFVRPPSARLGALEVFGAIGLLALLTARFVPLARWLPGWGCPMRDHLGVPCLTCGMTRAFDWFLQGRFADSLAVNPLGFALACAILVGVFYLVAAPLRPPRPAFSLSYRTGTVVRVAAVTLLGLNWGYLLVRALITRG